MAMQRVDILDVSSSELKEDFLPGMTDALVRECCREEKTGGQHFVIEMKAGFSAPAGYNSASMDIYVLEGSFSLGDDTLTVGCYTYIPGGMACGDWHSENGARVLFFTNKKSCVSLISNKSSCILLLNILTESELGSGILQKVPLQN